MSCVEFEKVAEEGISSFVVEVVWAPEYVVCGFIWCVARRAFVGMVVGMFESSSVDR